MAQSFRRLSRSTSGRSPRYAASRLPPTSPPPPSPPATTAVAVSAACAAASAVAFAAAFAPSTWIECGHRIDRWIRGILGIHWIHQLGIHQLGIHQLGIHQLGIHQLGGGRWYRVGRGV